MLLRASTWLKQWISRDQEQECPANRGDKRALLPEDGTRQREDEAKTLDRKRGSGLPLTLIFLTVTLICCTVWALTLLQCVMSRKSQSDKHNGEFVTFTETPTHVNGVGEGQCHAVPDEYRFDCYPSPGSTKESCLARGCCFDPVLKAKRDKAKKGHKKYVELLDIPYCYYPAGYQLYGMYNFTGTKTGAEVLYKLQGKSGYPGDVHWVKLELIVLGDDTLRIKITDANHARFEVPDFSQLPQKEPVTVSHPEYTIVLSSTGFGFQVQRGDGTILFDTLHTSGFIYSSQLLQISSLLPSHFLYGLGEHGGTFLRDTAEWKQYTMWNLDSAPVAFENSNLYGTHPFYLAMEPDTGKSHGVYLKNSNAMEIIVQPTPAITYRSLGGILDFYVFFGTDPNAAIEQYTDIIGKPFLPPFWALGYHQCRFGYGSVNRTKAVLDQTIKAGIPIDTQWNDIDYMSHRNDFTLDEKKFEGLHAFVEELHKNGMHYIPIIDPGVSGAEAPGTYPPYDLGMDMNVFIKNVSGHVFVGRVWNPKSTVWPDFTHTNATKYWTKQFEEFYKRVAIDGAWIDMNEPSNFDNGQAAGVGCPKDNPLDHPPYVPRFLSGGKLYYKTVCPSARHEAGSHYDLHNMFGLTETVVTYRALAAVRHAKRPFIISRSTFPGQGHFGGHWTGDIYSNWDSMRQTIAGVLNFNLFGTPMVGSDICGFNGNTTAQLCQRWMQLGAFYPFSRNHNTDTAIDQDPVSLGPAVAASSKHALEIRYQLLPFLYTLFVEAHLKGRPVARPLFFAYPQDWNAYSMAEEQFMWGDELMIVPVLTKDAETVSFYLPTGVWYDFHTSEQIVVEGSGSFRQRAAPKDLIPLFVRGGSILPGKPKAKTTTVSRKLGFRLSAYLDSTGAAQGRLYWDDGDSMDSYSASRYNHVVFECKDFSELKTKVVHFGYPEDKMALDSVTIYGLKKKPSEVKVNGKSAHFHYDEKKKMIGIPNVSVSMSEALYITF